MSRPASTGIILAGGTSSRMGRDKASLDIGERTSLQHVIEAAQAVCDEVIVASGRNVSPVSSTEGVRYVEDLPGVAGPLAGLVAGMRATEAEACLILACDMPFADPALLRELLASLDGCLAVVPVFDGKPQPLQAAYSRDCLAVAESILRLGDSSVRSLVERVPTRFIAVSKDTGRGLSGFNMNTAADLDTAREQWSKQQRCRTRS